MRFFIGLVLVLAVGVVGCSETAGTGGSGGDGGVGGDGGTGGMTGQVFPCTEQGIRDAIAEGGGPHAFNCDGPQTIVLDSAVPVDNSVILDGEGIIRLASERQSGFAEPLFIVQTSLELRGFRLSNPFSECIYGGTDELKVVDSVFEDCGISFAGLLQVEDCTFSDAGISIGGGGGEAGTIVNTSFFGGGISVFTGSSVTLIGSTLSGGSIVPGGFGGDGTAVTLVNSTISGSDGEAIRNIDDITLISSTIADNNDTFPALSDYRTLNVSNSIVDGECDGSSGSITSSGYNIESPGDTCGFDQPTDQVNVSADDLKLEPLQDNGGPTMTHALGDGSVAIDQIPAVDCVDADGEPLATDQRGFPRDSMCDVGAFEWIVTDCTGEETFTPCTYDGGDAWCWLEQCAAFDCSDLEDGTYCEFAVLGDGTKGVCEAGKCTKPQDCTGLVDGWDCNVGGEDGGICDNGKCVRPQ